MLAGSEERPHDGGVTSTKTRTAVALALAAVAPAALAGPALAAKTSSKVSIQKEEDGVSGFVLSAKESCHSGRKVVVYRKVAGPDKKAGSDTAQPNGDGSQWKVSLSRSGKYYAVVKATSKCKGATSKTVSFSPAPSEEG
jgi:hypothetical protein